ncbi:hypothetical protein PHLGIDRAFT_460177 [Phlebiopsis gigantea 11061_1 CR5-6]|uniref:Uncharacterized protein n=1 Tax=Phlebiopsis gigantea (strain 11061_1 CR5-6) TaxID=745531 RepID=A0A0C3S6Z7_PHLG1|nr:hypothetical protein PHLGIDRAFT_460177 [Phlebiopsis gigantea 11061_1 CR5-6]
MLEIIGFVQVDLFTALRVSAIWGHSRILFLVIFMLGLVPVLTNSFTLAHTNYEYFGHPIGCMVTGYGSFANVLTMFVYLGRSALIVQDSLVIVLTLIKTFHQWREARKSKLPLSISTCLIRDGVTYFL